MALDARFQSLLAWTASRTETTLQDSRGTTVAAQPQASGARSAPHCTDRQLVSLEHAVALVSAGGNITVEVLSDWAPDAETTASSSPSSSSVRHRYLSVKSGMIIRLRRQGGGWWLGFEEAAEADSGMGWLPDMCFVVWVIHKAFTVDRSQGSLERYLKLDIGDEVVVKDRWDQGPWKGWARGEKRSTNGASAGLFPVSCATQHVITVSRRDRSRSRQNQPRSRES